MILTISFTSKKELAINCVRRNTPKQITRDGLG